MQKINTNVDTTQGRDSFAAIPGEKKFVIQGKIMERVHEHVTFDGEKIIIENPIFRKRS